MRKAEPKQRKETTTLILQPAFTVTPLPYGGWLKTKATLSNVKQKRTGWKIDEWLFYSLF
jgi:hypothetical protein